MAAGIAQPGWPGVQGRIPVLGRLREYGPVAETTLLSEWIAAGSLARFGLREPGRLFHALAREVFVAVPFDTAQADAIQESSIYVDAVVEIDVPDEEIGGNNRRPIHLAGPISYGQLTLKRGMTTDFGLWEWFEAVQRDDDKEDTVKARLKVYHDQTAPLIDYYSTWAEQGGEGAPRYIKVDGVGGVDAIRESIIGRLSQP